MKHHPARDGPVNRFLDIEATVGDNDEEDEEDEEDNDGASAGAPPDYSLQLHFLGGFIEDEPPINGDQPTPWTQMDKLPNREGGWHDFVASLGERYTSGSKTNQHIVENNSSHEWPPLDPALVSCMENMPVRDGYPFWRVRCKVTDSFPLSCLIRTPCLGRLSTSYSSVFTSDGSAGA
jgi:hypothetical protein